MCVSTGELGVLLTCSSVLIDRVLCASFYFVCGRVDDSVLRRALPGV